MLHVRGLGGVDVTLRKGHPTQTASAGAALCLRLGAAQLVHVGLPETCAAPVVRGVQGACCCCDWHRSILRWSGPPVAHIYISALASSVGSYHFFPLSRPHPFATSELLICKAIQVFGTSNTSLAQWAASCGHPRPTIALAAALHRQQQSALQTNIDASAAASCCAGWRGCDGVATPRPL